MYDPWQFIQSVLASALIAAVLNNIVNIWLKSFDFDNKYKEEVIKRRFEAYSDICDTISVFKIKHLNTDTGRSCHAFLVNGKEYFDAVGAAFHKCAAQHGIWVSKDTRDQLNAFRDYLYSLYQDLKPYSDETRGEGWMRSYGESNLDKIQGFLDRIDRTIVVDLRSIKDIKKFLDEGPQ